MSEVWAVLVSLIIILIVYGIVSSRLRARRLKRLTRELLPEVSDHFKAGTHYRIALTSGSIFENVRFLGISHVDDPRAQHLPFPLQHWVVLEKSDGKRLFVKPHTIKYYEEA